MVSIKNSNMIPKVWRQNFPSCIELNITTTDSLVDFGLLSSVVQHANYDPTMAKTCLQLETKEVHFLSPSWMNY